MTPQSIRTDTRDAAICNHSAIFSYPVRWNMYTTMDGCILLRLACPSGKAVGMISIPGRMPIHLIAMPAAVAMAYGHGCIIAFWASHWKLRGSAWDQ